MCVLTRDEIQRELDSGRLRIEPLCADQIGPASIDLHIGGEIRVLARSRTEPLQVTDDVLRDNPANERALAVRARLQVRPHAGDETLRTLERWLANLERRQPREVGG